LNNFCFTTTLVLQLRMSAALLRPLSCGTKQGSILSTD